MRALPASIPKELAQLTSGSVAEELRSLKSRFSHENSVGLR